MASLTVENYVKRIYQICAAQADKPAATGQIAQEMEVSPGTVTSMLKTLREGELVEYTPYEGVALTDSGRRLALQILRRHRLIEVFLFRTLNLDWSEVHDEAEHLEHAVSDGLIDRIDAYLGYPKVDPHGDPIPSADGTLHVADSRPLVDLAVGEAFRLVRVLEQSNEFLSFLSEQGLALESVGRVTANRREAGIVTVEVDGRPTTLGRDAAAKLLVVPN